MTAFLLSVSEAWPPRVGGTVTFLLSVGVSGSVPDRERASPLLHPRVSVWVGLGRVGNGPLLFPPRVSA